MSQSTVPFTAFEGDELILPSATVGAECRTKTGRNGIVVADGSGGTVCRPNDSVDFRNLDRIDATRPTHTLTQLQPGQVEVLVLTDHTDPQSKKMWRKGERYAAESVRAQELAASGQVEIVGDLQPAALYQDNAKAAIPPVDPRAR